MESLRARSGKDVNSSEKKMFWFCVEKSLIIKDFDYFHIFDYLQNLSFFRIFTIWASSDIPTKRSTQIPKKTVEFEFGMTYPPQSNNKDNETQSVGNRKKIRLLRKFVLAHVFTMTLGCQLVNPFPRLRSRYIIRELLKRVTQCLQKNLHQSNWLYSRTTTSKLCKIRTAGDQKTKMFEL